MASIENRRIKMKIYIIPSKNIFKYGFKITDEKNNPIGSITARTFEIERKLIVSSRTGGATISTSIGALKTTMQVIVGGKNITIVRKPSLLNTRVDISGLPWAIKGVCENNDYKIVEGRKLIAKISNEGFFGGKIAVEISNPGDELYVTAVVAAMIAAKDGVATKGAMENS